MKSPNCGRRHLSLAVDQVRLPLRDEQGEIIGVFGSYEDISDRKQAEIALQESEERFRQLAENINQVFWLTTPDHQEILYVSPAYEEIWGLPMSHCLCRGPELVRCHSRNRSPSGPGNP
jgi:PAS domain-containing protein